MKGGYQVISFSSYTGSENEKINGAYKKASSGKAILIEDFIVETDGPKTSFFALAIPAESGIDIVFTYGQFSATINVAEDDTITVTPNE